jgi:hypothetical protein
MGKLATEANLRSIKTGDLKIMKGYIKGQSIILIQPLPENIQDGDEVEVSLCVVPQKKYPFPTFNLEIKDEYLKREKIYESD